MSFLTRRRFTTEEIGEALHADESDYKTRDGVELEFRNLFFSVSNRDGGNIGLLTNVSGRLRAGRVTAVMGPSGAGKSTLLDILAGIPSPGKVSGSILIDGSPQIEWNMKDLSAYVMQQDVLPATSTVRETIVLSAMLKLPRNMPNEVKLQRVQFILRDLDLETCADTLIGNEILGKKGISGGQRRRTSLGIELVKDPLLIFLDEPTSGLDPNQLADIRELIRTIGKEKTLMFSTHIMQEVEAICDRVVIINRGKIVADGKAEDLANQQKRGFTIEVEFDKAFDINSLRNINGVKKVRSLKGNSFELIYEGEADIRPDIFKLAVDKQATVLTINRKELKLEEVFQQLTR